MHINNIYNGIEESICRGILHHASDCFFARGKRPTFIEIGANDGVRSSKTYEFVRYHDWGGLSVEPVPQVYASLSRNLAPFNKVKAVQAAVSNHSGILPFYQVIGRESRQGDAWLPMMSSFDRNVILKQANIVPDIERYIEEIAVPVRTVADLCAENCIADFDVLMVDAEGHDDTIVKSVDFDQFHPQIVAVEHIHLSPDRMRSLDAHMMRDGYMRCIMWMDTMWFRGEILREEPVQRMIRTLPTFIPEYQPAYGNGYWLSV